MGRVVLHVDADAFFVQVEQLRHPELQGKPVAVQQHQDIIAANHAAKKAGVRKHMAPREARAVLAGVGGHVVHVFLEDGFRASYRPYREMCAALIRLYKGFSSAVVVEKASIDEAFILIAGSDNGSGASSSVGGGAGDSQLLLSRGQQLAHDIRATAKKELGITLSVGVAPNKLLAKLASNQAKPDGVKVIPPGSGELADLLANTTIEQLPGMGGRVSSSLARTGTTTCNAVSALLAHNPLALQQLGLPAAKATLLAAYCEGKDDAAVVDKGPPKSIQVQMTLTPIPWPVPSSVLKPGPGMPVGQPSLHNSPNSSTALQAAAQAAAPLSSTAVQAAAQVPSPMCSTAVQSVVVPNPDGDSSPLGQVQQNKPQTKVGVAGGSTGIAVSRGQARSGAVVLQPLPVQGPDTKQRVTSVLRCMCRDLVARVVLDRHQEGRWPGKLGLSLHCQHPDHKGAYNTAGSSNLVSRSTAFPSASLLDAPTVPTIPSTASTPEKPQPQQQLITQVHAGHMARQLQHTTHPVSRPAVATPAVNLMVSERLFAPDGSDNTTGQQQLDTALLYSHNVTTGQPVLAVGDSVGATESRKDAYAGDVLDAASSEHQQQPAASAAAPYGVQAVLDAVLKSELGMTMSVLQQQPQGWVISLVAVSASNMQSIDKNSAPTITRFLRPATHANSEPGKHVPTGPASNAKVGPAVHATSGPAAVAGTGLEPEQQQAVHALAAAQVVAIPSVPGSSVTTAGHTAMPEQTAAAQPVGVAPPIAEQTATIGPAASARPATVAPRAAASKVQQTAGTSALTADAAAPVNHSVSAASAGLVTVGGVVRTSTLFAAGSKGQMAGTGQQAPKLGNKRQKISMLQYVQAAPTSDMGSAGAAGQVRSLKDAGVDVVQQISKKIRLTEVFASLANLTG